MVVKIIGEETANLLVAVPEAALRVALQVALQVALRAVLRVVPREDNHPTVPHPIKGVLMQAFLYPIKKSTSTSLTETTRQMH